MVRLSTLFALGSFLAAAFLVAALIVIFVHERAPTLSAQDLVPTAGVITAPSAVVTPNTHEQLPENSDLLQRAIAALEADLDQEALVLRAQMADASTARLALDWVIATAYPSVIPLSELVALRDKFADWPGLSDMDANIEQISAQSPLGALQRLIGKPQTEPVTISGKIAAAQALVAQNKPAQARALIVPLWHEATLWPALEADLPERFASVLTTQDHQIRYFNMMVRERITAADLIVDLAEMGSIHAAWTAVIRNQRAAADLVAALDPAQLDTPHGIYMRVELARKSRLLDEAAELLLLLPEDEQALINPDAWWREIRIVSRSLRENGDSQTAYTLAARQISGNASTRIDAAFHAGWYALRGLGDASLALKHFETINELATLGASKARGLYWSARALAASDNTDLTLVEQTYRRAARYSTTYHGQLALAALGQPLVVAPKAANSTSVDPLKNEAARAGILLVQSDQQSLGHKLLVGLAETISDENEIALLADVLNERGMHHTSLKLAKAAAADGKNIGAGTHPVGALPLDFHSNARDLALGYAIARQESEFRLDAVSSANAKGLLQLLPSTARGVAARLDMPFDEFRLTTDAAYNTTLGTRYLAEQLERFDGSYVLTFIAYNAGPGRAREWIERFGDPRGLTLEQTIDWIEQIPFPETLDYVQKVMENLQVYKARLKAQPDIVGDLTAGRR